jgi:hypothetical protein
MMPPPGTRASAPSQLAGKPDEVYAQALLLPIATTEPLANVICMFGLIAVVGWLAWRLGPTLARLGGWGSWWLAWACGSQGGYIYCAFFLVLGAIAWGAGTLWYARRRGRWPSRLSAWLFARPLGQHNPVDASSGGGVRD